MDQSLRTVDVLRRGFGRRYTGLPIDTISRDGFTIDCTAGYMRPEMFDLRVGDTVRWSQNGRYIQATIARVERNGHLLTVALSDSGLLPTDFFPY